MVPDAFSNGRAAGLWAHCLDRKVADRLLMCNIAQGAHKGPGGPQGPRGAHKGLAHKGPVRAQSERLILGYYMYIYIIYLEVYRFFL